MLKVIEFNNERTGKKSMCTNLLLSLTLQNNVNCAVSYLLKETFCNNVTCVTTNSEEFGMYISHISCTVCDNAATAANYSGRDLNGFEGSETFNYRP